MRVWNIITKQKTTIDELSIACLKLDQPIAYFTSGRLPRFMLTLPQSKTVYPLAKDHYRLPKRSWLVVAASTFHLWSSGVATACNSNVIYSLTLSSYLWPFVLQCLVRLGIEQCRFFDSLEPAYFHKELPMLAGGNNCSNGQLHS